MKKLFVNSIKDKVLRFIHKSIYKPGHYYSAVPNPLDIETRKDQIFNFNKNLKGINLNESFQLSLLKNCKADLALFPYKNLSNLFRYKAPNNFFGKGDALALFIIMNKYKTKRIIEVGSGYSSAAMLDFNELTFNSSVQYDFIEPYPDRLNSLLNETDKKNVKIHQKFVQNIPIDFFEKLDENDILFIDSSHVSKIGSDVNYLLFDVIPNLKKGVIIHIHDVTYPFEYPKDFVDYGIYWNEAYLLRAFLSYNNDFEIILWNDFLEKKHQEVIKEIDPLYSLVGGGSIWIRKLVD